VAVQYFILSIVQILKKDEHNLLVNALDLILKISLKVCLFLSKKKKLVQNLSHVYEIKLKEKKINDNKK
jgi:hypothetical protein